MMTKKDLILLADHIKQAPKRGPDKARFTDVQIRYLAKFCKRINPAFKEDRWINYIAGNCGPNGGKIKNR